MIGTLRGSIAVFFTAMLLSMSMAGASPGQHIDQVRFSARLTHVNVEDVLKHIEEKTGLHFLYLGTQVNYEKPFDFSVKNKTVSQTLAKLLKGKGLTYKQIDDQVIIHEIEAAASAEKDNSRQQQLQFGSVVGKVFDASNGEPLPGATVRVKGTGVGTVTDLTGYYFIAKAPLGAQTLVVSYIGYQELEKQVEVLEDDMVIANFELEVSATELSNITISGLIEGQTKALNQQKAAENIKSIVLYRQTRSVVSLI
jgi:hypothetical protein